MQPDSNPVSELDMQENERIVAAYRRLFTTPDGKTVLNDLRDAYYDVPLFDTNPAKLAKATAQHEVVLNIITLIEEIE